MAIQDRYALLSGVVRIANSAHLSYPDRLRKLTRYMVKTFPVESATIYLLDEDRRHLSLCFSSIGPPTKSRCYLPLGEGVAGVCAADRKILREKTAALHADEPCTGRETSMHAIPLIDCGVIALGIGSQPSPVVDDVSLLKDLVTPIEGLLQRIKLSESSARRVRNLTRLSEMAQHLNRPAPPSEMLPLILDGCFRYSDACCVMLRLSEGKGLPAGLFKKHHQKVRPLLPELVAMEQEYSGRVTAHGISQLACDLIAEGEFPPSLISVPLKFKARFLGTLTFFGKKGSNGYCRNYDGEDRDVCENIGILVANALAEAANYEQLMLVSRENDKKLKEFSLLYNISNVMLSTIRLNKLVHLAMAALVAGPESSFERAMLFLINDRAGVLQGMLGVTREDAARLFAPSADGNPLLGADFSEEELAHQQESEFCCAVRATRLAIDRNLNACSRAVVAKRVILVTKLSGEDNLDREFVRRFGLSSFAIVPLMAKDRVIGVVIVDNPVHNREITEDDLHFLQLFTNQAGMAIQNSMLYNRLEDANRSLREARERIIHGARLATIGEMSATIAHELKGPLVSMGGFARRLEQRFPQGTTEATYAATISREVQRLEKMLTEILSFAKKTTICYNHCNINDIIEDALAIVGPALDESGITVSKKYPKKIISFLGDAQQLKQVFINLFFNSQEAIQRGGNLDIVVAPARLGGKRAVSVKILDSGGGIPLKILNQIFNPFYTTKPSGTGLGLPVANRIVINHGGKIHVNNRETGAEFNVLLPLDR